MIKRISAQQAARIDKELMGSCGFSIDQLMELAGQAVAHALYRVHPPSKGSSVLVLVGPGNNGGDGLVASRHLSLMGYEPKVYCPKPTSGALFDGLRTQLEVFKVPYVSTDELSSAFSTADIIVDALFGFSFKPPVRESFVPVMDLLSSTSKPTLAVDIPSSWDVDNGPSGSKFIPSVLVSLTAPKKCADSFNGRHFIGGRFITPAFAEKYEFDVPPYEGTQQVYEELN